MVTGIPKLRQELIDVVFPGKKEDELLRRVETDFEGFFQEWRRKRETPASLELMSEIQAIFPEKFTPEVVRAINTNF